MNSTSSCFIIAEIGVNHNGDIKLAKQMIDEAAIAKVDAVKFQTYKTEQIVTKSAQQAEYQKINTKSDQSQFELLKKLELEFEDFIELKKYSEEKGITFLSTAADIESANFLNKINVKAFKIGSGEVTNLPLIKHIAKFNKTIILSTGMSTLKEVNDALSWIKEEGNNDTVLLHCTSNYPCPLNEVNLNAMKTLEKEFSVPVGYSDHTEGIEVSVLAVAMGATIIEKHFTLDKNLPGPDHKASLNYSELTQLVSQIRKTELIMGNFEKVPSEAEIRISKLVRKSLVASKDFKKGEIITMDHLATKRPFTGISPKEINEVIGKKSLKDITKDSIIRWENLQ
ncbi:MAG: N-acetylneuraminate synthase [Bacteroidia bacterium]|nr:N-acetylneuraminate synthase [Bacteroidia bacterium]